MLLFLSAGCGIRNDNVGNSVAWAVVVVVLRVGISTAQVEDMVCVSSLCGKRQARQHTLLLEGTNSSKGLVRQHKGATDTGEEKSQGEFPWRSVSVSSRHRSSRCTKEKARQRPFCVFESIQFQNSKESHFFGWLKQGHVANWQACVSFAPRTCGDRPLLRHSQANSTVPRFCREGYLATLQ